MALVLARVAGDVEAGLRSRAREGDVAPFLEACLAGAEDEGALDGEALGGVAGERVGVADVAGLEVAAAELDGGAAVGGDRQRPLVAVDALDGAAGAVLDAEAVGVAEADDAVAGGELAVGDGERARCRGGRRLSMSARASWLSSATSRRRRASMTLPARSSRACSHQSASRRARVVTGLSETTSRSRFSA